MKFDEALEKEALRAVAKLQGSGNLTRLDKDRIVSVLERYASNRQRISHHNARDLAFLREIKGNIDIQPDMAMTMIDDWIHELEQERRL